MKVGDKIQYFGLEATVIQVGALKVIIALPSGVQTTELISDLN